ncbi:MAG: FtsW/RodA/SpoVE family cell cycle protein [Gemmatimonadales bacterium]
MTAIIVGLRLHHAGYRADRPGQVPPRRRRHQPDLPVGPRPGSGKAFGVGFGQGQQKFGYLAYSYSDFVFSSVGEEWGFVGVVVIVFLFALFCWLGFRSPGPRKTPSGSTSPPG